jgi:drug/metabolite transporter (DMT)-like permease
MINAPNNSPLLKKTKYTSFKWMLIATFFFSIMGLCVKLCSGSYNEYELVFYRSFISLLILIPIIRLKNISFKTKYFQLHLARSVIGFISLALFFYAITKLPLGTAMSLNYTSPIFLGLFMPLLTKQKFQSTKLTLIALGFIGIIFILKPVLNNNFIAGSVGLLSGLGAAIAYILVAKLGQLKEPDVRTVFYFTLISSVGSFALMLNTNINPITMDHNLIYLLGLGVSATVAQVAITRAYREGKTLNNASYSYLTVIFSVLWGVVFFKEILDLLTLVGIVFIIISGSLASQKKS